MDYKLAATAANWWCKEIKNRYRKLHLDETNESFEEKIELFEQLLTSEIHQQLKIYHYITMGCYYFPDETLLKVSKETGINKCYLPVHAHLEIVHNSLYVSLGYDDPHILTVDS